MGKAVIKNRILAVLCLTMLLLTQVMIVYPCLEKNEAYAAGGSLEIRVQYEGWREDKIPTKTVMTRSDLEAISTSAKQYINVTDVATTMRIIAKGPTIPSLLDTAGIDRSSVQYIIFRTGDGSGRDSRYSLKIYPSMYENDRLYYPNLFGNYEKDYDEGIIRPKEGSLSNPQRVPAILAVSYYTTKSESSSVDESKIEYWDQLRFCIGQTELRENEWTAPGYDGDVTSHESVHSIFGMDVILKGSPLKGMSLGLDNTDIKVGSSGKIKITASGDELFMNDMFSAEDMTWTSSDESVATVSSDGTLTVVGKGTAVITATAPDGTAAQVVINGTAGKEKDPAETDSEQNSEEEIIAKIAGKVAEQTGRQVRENKTGPANETLEKIRVRELNLGDMVTVEEADRVTGDEEISALGEAEDYSRGALAGTIATTAAAATGGFVLRIRKYHIDK